MSLKDLRIQNNITQQALANKLGVSQQLLSKWENKKAIPPIKRAISLAKVLNVSSDVVINIFSDVE